MKLVANKNFQYDNFFNKTSIVNKEFSKSPQNNSCQQVTSNVIQLTQNIFLFNVTIAQNQELESIQIEPSSQHQAMERVRVLGNLIRRTQ